MVTVLLCVCAESVPGGGCHVGDDQLRPSVHVTATARSGTRTQRRRVGSALRVPGTLSHGRQARHPRDDPRKTHVGANRSRQDQLPLQAGAQERSE